MYLNLHTPGGSEGSGLNKLRIPGSVGLKTYFHKGSGDFWWALVIVLDILLKCIHIAWIIMQGNQLRLWGEILRHFFVINSSEESKLA